MEIRRTANAGVLLKLDGVTILLDGVCREVKPYPVTPPEELEAIRRSWPDVVAFTHAHKDHYDPAFAAQYQKQTGGVILGPEDLPGCHSTMEKQTIGGVSIMPVVSRHIGVAGKTTSHASFVICGSRTIWFLGDSSPLQWKNRSDLPHPDVLLVPYAYANSLSGWAVIRVLAPEKTVILHMPKREEDSIGLWSAVESVTAGEKADFLCIPEIGETVIISDETA